ncbi:MD-2-related lipid-recognition protein-like [Ostrinia nubilalis]|uniref:MD-2-related lipid-recognition protein-like n=1 Tax=Ostrinia nubilalis TaxID=29057 RepID=UPI003082367B
MKQQIAVAILAILAVAAAHVSVTKKCESVSQDACTIQELRITPCLKEPCALRKGHNATMQFDYTPNFSAEKLKTAVYHAADATNTPFSSVGIADACLYTTCPAVPGTQHTLTYQLYIGKKLPSGTFWFRWKLWNDANESEVCCFETKIKLK